MSHSDSKRDYKHALGLVRTAISEWDPYGLIAKGAPPDEFASESAKIVALSREFATPSDAIRAVSMVFWNSFKVPQQDSRPQHDLPRGDARFNEQNCESVGKRVFELLDAWGFLPEVNKLRGPLDIGLKDIWFHDAEIHRVVENPESDEIGFEVMYPVDWENNRFEPRTIVFIDVLNYANHEGACHGRPQILAVVQTGEKYRRAVLRIETNFGDRELLCKAIQIRPEWGMV